MGAGIVGPVPSPGVARFGLAGCLLRGSQTRALADRLGSSNNLPRCVHTPRSHDQSRLQAGAPAGLAEGRANGGRVVPTVAHGCPSRKGVRPGNVAVFALPPRWSHVPTGNAVSLGFHDFFPVGFGGVICFTFCSKAVIPAAKSVSALASKSFRPRSSNNAYWLCA